MSVLVTPWFTACAVLVAAGAAKLRRPDPTIGALRRLGLPTGRRPVLALGLAEILTGLAGLVTGTRAAAAMVAAFYLGFAAAVVVMLRRGGLVQTCGCFGAPDVPATRLHLAVNVAAAIVAFIGAIGGIEGAGDVLATGSEGALVIALSFIATVEVVLVLTVLPLVRSPRLDGAGAVSW